MRAEGPDSKYVMMWKGAWRPVVNMLDAAGHETNIALRATRVVMFIAPDYWAVAHAGPGDLIERTGRDIDKRHWDYID